ncbi:syntaxin-7-like [Polyodon spathula]|uniref:syntaxin-7-like n=1 Tax=Polyodon spathula TaxID=7913 RepID=UPI001B7F7852|nr:syntaxin-7-like [Polyodon spathula]XP_041106214.1 syntaxin-7-like [Polyodon spathula]
MSYQSGLDGDANRFAQTIGSNIQKITQHTDEIQSLVNQLGTPQDNTELRQQLLQKQQQANQLAKETDRYMKEFGLLPLTAEQRQRKIQKDRLVGDFSSALAAFQKIQRQAAQKEKEFVARVRASSRVSGGLPDGGLLSYESENQPQAQVQDDAIKKEDLMLIKERETSIRQLESDITDINEIFKDLGMMIHEQGDTIDSIEANVENAEIRVQSASQQLSRAAEHQCKSRKKICILVVILTLIAVAIGLIIWGASQI